MWKFIVSWVVSQTVSTSCPDAVKRSEYGVNVSYGCLAYHFKTVTTKHERSFMSRDSAITFIREGKALVDTFYLDSVKVKR